MQTYFLTDTGRVRSHNEDSVAIVENKSKEVFMIVADGMGGHKAGEIASAITVDHFTNSFLSNKTIGSKNDAINWLKKTISEANDKILEYTKEHPESTGMGTTCVCAVVTDNFLLFGNIGDSSGFVKKEGYLHKITHDHTLVNVLVEAGNLSEEEAASHPRKNVLMKALGAEEKIEMDIFNVERTVDEIMLCSDGLTNMLSQEQIEKVLDDESLTYKGKVNKLIRKSNARGGNDNISVAYVVLEGGDSRDI